MYKHSLYSVGYAGLDLAALKAYAEKRDAIIVDIRYAPYSRKPEWSQVNLRRELGPRYYHLLSFGNKNYKSPALPFELVSADTGVSVVEKMIAKNDLILLCVCYKVESCHRKHVADILALDLKLPCTHLSREDVSPALEQKETGLQLAFESGSFDIAVF